MHGSASKVSPNIIKHEKQNRDVNGGSTYGRIVVVVIAANVYCILTLGQA